MTHLLLQLFSVALYSHFLLEQGIFSDRRSPLCHYDLNLLNHASKNSIIIAVIQLFVLFLYRLYGTDGTISHEYSEFTHRKQSPDALGTLRERSFTHWLERGNNFTCQVKSCGTDGLWRAYVGESHTVGKRRRRNPVGSPA